MASITTEHQDPSGAMAVGSAAPAGTWQNQTVIIIDNRTPFEFGLVGKPFAALGQFEEVTSSIIAQGWNSLVGVIISPPEAPKAGTAGLMVYMFTAPMEGAPPGSGEQYFLCALASNPYGNATKNTACVELRDNSMNSDSDTYGEIARNNSQTNGFFVNGKMLQATVVIDQVTDTPTAHFKLTWGEEST